MFWFFLFFTYAIYKGAHTLAKLQPIISQMMGTAEFPLYHSPNFTKWSFQKSLFEYDENHLFTGDFGAATLYMKILLFGP